MKFLAAAKINLFLKIINKRNDGYHNIFTGVTFVNLYNEIIITPSNKNSIVYSGPFAPIKGFFQNDLVNKIFKYLFKEERRGFFVKIEIKKNIPSGAGLGSASADAAAIIRGLNALKLVNFITDYKTLSFIGADIPICLKSKDCIAEGIGEKIFFKIDFP